MSPSGSGDGASFTVTGPLWLWTGEKGSWHFLTVPEETASDIRLRNMARTGGFGSIRVEARIGGLAWRTSIVPVKRTGEYILPVKAEVRRRSGIGAGDQVSLSLELI